MYLSLQFMTAAAAGTEAEGNGVADVTQQLEKQALEDKEKEEDGEDGKRS